MLFNSFKFILIFLPLVLIGWHGLNYINREKLGDIFLVAASLLFYGLFSVEFVGILLVSCLVTYIIKSLIVNYRDSNLSRLLMGILYHVSINSNK